MNPEYSAESLNLFMQHTNDAVVEMNGRGCICSINPRFSAIFGFQADEILNQNVLTILADKSREKFKEQLQALINEESNQGKPYPNKPLLVTGRHRDAHSLPLELFILPYTNNGQQRIVSIIRDLSHDQQLSGELEASRDSYWVLSETTSDAIVQINQAFQIIFANSAVQSVFGHDEESLIDQDFGLLFPPPVYRRYADVFEKYFIIDDAHRKQSQLHNTVEVLGLKKTEEIMPLEISFGNSRNVRGERILTCIIRDITERKKIERKLRYLAYHDKLTDLGNRDLFNISLSHFLSQVKRYKDAIGALLFMDLDGFKKVNDSLGHNVGDKILVECARRLISCLRESDYIYRFSETKEPSEKSYEDLFRFGGDEFVVLLTHLAKRTDAAVVGQKIIDAIRKPFILKGYKSLSKISLGASIGIALIPENGDDPTALISSADVAMYKAKEQGNQCQYFTKDMNARASERLMMETGLRTALEEEAFELHYQPLMSSQGVILGLEALLRWEDPRLGRVSPDRFIPIAEETGLMQPIGVWVFETACKLLRYWNTSGYTDLHVSVNLSSRQFNRIDLVKLLSQAIKKIGVNAKNLRIEITESSIMQHPAEARETMKQLKKQNEGIRIAIDDFGTGYSSLSYLSEFPVDILKIDRTFVMNLNRKTNKKIVNTIIALGQSLDLEIVAEGVETKEQLEYLNQNGCTIYQGFHFHHPLTVREVNALLRKARANESGA